MEAAELIKQPTDVTECPYSETVRALQSQKVGLAVPFIKRDRITPFPLTALERMLRNLQTRESLFHVKPWYIIDIFCVLLIGGKSI